MEVKKVGMATTNSSVKLNVTPLDQPLCVQVDFKFQCL